MSRYAGNTHVGSGLLSLRNPRFQAGMRAIAAGLDGAMFHQSLSGYASWERIADTAIRNEEPFLILVGHSNYAHACLKIAERVREHNIQCYIVVLDKTLLTSPKAGSNVVELHEFWAGLKKVRLADDFKGAHTFHDYEELTHIGLIEDESVQQQVIKIVSGWKEKLESK